MRKFHPTSQDSLVVFTLRRTVVTFNSLFYHICHSFSFVNPWLRLVKLTFEHSDTKLTDTIYSINIWCNTNCTVCFMSAFECALFFKFVVLLNFSWQCGISVFLIMCAHALGYAKLSRIDR